MSNSVGRLHGKVALVTGGAAGLGKAIALRLAHEGAAIVVTDVDVKAGQATADEGRGTFFEQDVCDEGRWVTIVEEIEKRLGRLDVLVNNAAILGPLDAVNPESSRYEDWKRVFRVNVDSVFLGCRAGIGAMRRAGGGSIVNMSSVAGLLATPYATAYGASKATVRQMTKSVAQHCAEQRLNIRCNSVHPGVVRTAMVENYAHDLALTRGISPEEMLQGMRSTIPMGEFATPEDIAATVAFLASDESRHITGAKLVVDGGIIYCDTYRARQGEHRSGNDDTSSASVQEL